MALVRYRYPDSRSRPNPADGKPCGVAGRLERVARQCPTQQPVCGFDWSPDKAGLFVCASLDQCIRLGFVTRTNAL